MTTTRMMETVVTAIAPQQAVGMTSGLTVKSVMTAIVSMPTSAPMSAQSLAAVMGSRARDPITAASDCALIGALVGIDTIAVITLFTVSPDVIPTACWGAIAVTTVSIILVVVIAALCETLQTVPACIDYAQACA